MGSPVHTKSARATAVAAACLLLAACAGPPADCPYDDEATGAASAGCFVVTGQGLLVVQHHEGSVSMPGGSVEAGESARCAAARETLAATGARVTGGDLLHRFGRGFELFACTLHQADAQFGTQMPEEIADAYFLPRERFQGARWRFPDDRAVFERLYERRGKAGDERDAAGEP